MEGKLEEMDYYIWLRSEERRNNGSFDLYGGKGLVAKVPAEISWLVKGKMIASICY